MKRKIIITEKQEQMLIAHLISEAKIYPVDTDKVLLLKKFLDDNFKRATMSDMGDNGSPKTIQLVGMLDNNGEVVKNLTDVELFDYLQDKFQNLYSNNIQRDKFIAQVIKDWYHKKITKDGLLSVNLY